LFCNSKLFLRFTDFPFIILCKNYNEQVQSSKYQNSNLTFAKHLNDTGQTLGPMERIMDTSHFVKKGKLMNALEKCFIHSETMRNNWINEDSTTGFNKIYDVVIQHENQRCWLWLNARLPVHSLPQSHLIISTGKHCSTTTL